MRLRQIGKLPRDLMKRKQSVIHGAQNTATVLIIGGYLLLRYENEALQRLEPLQERERSRDL